jgi:predicted nuclease with RNAse H fold
MAKVAGIDIGGAKKGCHLVILDGRQAIAYENKLGPMAMLQICLDQNVLAVGIDAPCKWRDEGRMRLAEHQMNREKIHCFQTPTEAAATQSAFYAWMLEGEKLYRTFRTRYQLLETPAYSQGLVCFETFPHAITCAIRGDATAAKKRTQRREVLEQRNLDTSQLTNIDLVDAALCALAAQYLLRGETRAFGDRSGGFIHVPALMPAMPALPAIS